MEVAVVVSPFEDPLADLPPTARTIVETTRRLLLERGYPSLSLETISDECGLNKSAVRYYFKNKAGLMTTVVDAWIYDNISLLDPASGSTEDGHRLHTFLRIKEEMSENTDAYLAFFELLPAMLRDERHTGRIVDLYAWAIHKYGEFFADAIADLSPEERSDFGRLIIAVVDGLGVQYALAPDRFQASGVYRMLESILTVWMDARASGTTRGERT